MREKRKRVWIDWLQTQLSLRIIIYFTLYQIAVWALVIIQEQLSVSVDQLVGGTTFGFLVFLGSFNLVVAGLFINDAIRFSHRIVGPLYRFRQTIRAITEGSEVDLIALRKTDYLQELKEEFNEMIKVLEQRGALTIKEAEAVAQEQPSLTK